MRLVFHPASAFSYLGLVLAWALVWLLTGDLLTTVIFAAVIVLALWSFHAFITKKHQPDFFKSEEKEAIFTITYSVAISMALLTALPYVLFHESFLNPYIMLWLYLLPVMFVLFFLVHSFHHYFREDKVHVVPAMKFAAIAGIALLAVLTVALYGAFAYGRAQFEQSAQSTAERLKITTEPPPAGVPFLAEMQQRITAAGAAFESGNDFTQRLHDSSLAEMAQQLSERVRATIITNIREAEYEKAIAIYKNTQAFDSAQKEAYANRLAAYIEQHRKQAPSNDAQAMTYSQLHAQIFRPVTGPDMASSGMASLFGDNLFGNAPIQKSVSYAVEHTTTARDVGLAFISLFDGVGRPQCLAEANALEQGLADEPLDSRFLRLYIVADYYCVGSDENLCDQQIAALNPAATSS